MGSLHHLKQAQSGFQYFIHSVFIIINRRFTEGILYKFLEKLFPFNKRLMFAKFVYSLIRIVVLAGREVTWKIIPCVTVVIGVQKMRGVGNIRYAIFRLFKRKEPEKLFSPVLPVVIFKVKKSCCPDVCNTLHFFINARSVYSQSNRNFAKQNVLNPVTY